MRNDPNHNVHKVLKANAEKKKQQNEESETYVRGTAPVRATYGGKTDSFEKIRHKKKKSKKVEVDEKYQGMYQSPAPTHNRLISSDEKARMSPGRRAMAKSDELQKSEPDSKRAKAQKKAASQMARNFQSARATKEEVETISERGPHGRTGSRTGSSSEKPERRLKSRRFERFGNPGRSDYLKKRRAELDRMGVAANHADAPLVDEAKVETIDEAGKKCWKGYKKAGTQKLFGKTYNRCVKANEEIEVQEATSRPKATQRGKLSKADAQQRQARLDRIAAAKERSGEVKPKTGETPTPKKEKKEKIDPRLERAGNQVLRSIRNEAKDETEEGITGGPIRKKKRSPKKQHDFEKERRSERKKRGEFEKVGDNFSRHRMTGSRGHGTGGDNPRISYIHNNQYEMESDWRSDLGEDWQKVNKSDKTDGMSQKAVNAYRRENPGSKLKTAVTGNPKPGSKDAKRRSAYCSRSEGQKKMHNIDCTKTPDKAICKARRRWKC